MKKLSLVFLFSTALIFSSCNDGNKSAADQVEDGVNAIENETDLNMEANDSQDVTELRIQIESRSNSGLSGEAVFTEENGEVTLVANVSGGTEGEHAIHIHEKADCSADDATSGGGHWNPTFADHGKWGDEAGYHRGDIGNFDVDAEGNGSITFSTDEWCIGCGDDQRDILGKSIMVHAGADDFTSQPSGDAGARVGCGEITE